ncbi:heparinase II/III-family protein [Paenibacillus doosanensis]|uniref:Heparinase II/III-like protein n=1 Tax=Paenibacillus konkukensis TaxID=2020716 RepID=A0ABY4RYE9_9BACL|nr:MULTISPECIES: heparinase II/III family protein [Paenibacillus]MCS7458667.1 heparinase II/III-family protein [Paenibacillus doosanensis]UQZ86810.1 Heparinase II/III-like protein [Paenibacillus konkukensis]
MFSSTVTQEYAAERLQSAAQFHPFPKAGERAFWEAVPDSIRAQWIEWAQERLAFEWPALPAVRYMDFVRNGNRTKYEAAYFERRRALTELVVAECLEGQGRFMEPIMNGIWCLCEETYWVVPAHMSISLQSRGFALPDVTEQVIDLFAAETGALLTWTAYLLDAQLEREEPMIGRRIRHEIRRRIIEPYLDREDFWWMGFIDRTVNNWNPWIHSNCLAALLVLEEDPFVRSRAVSKAARSLDAFVGVYHPDGGCDEGASYWGRAGASLFDCLELLYEATGGQIDFYGEPLIQEIGKYIYRVHIDGNHFVNFADGDAKLTIAGDLVYRYGKRIGDARMSRLGAYAFQGNGFFRDKIPSLHRIVAELMDANELLREPVSPPYERDVWLKDTHIFAARERGDSSAGLYLAAKGGHNDESHNHNDVGHFVVYYNGHPFLIDAGVESYTAKTFSPRRYEIWTMQSAYHSLPTVNGVQQQPGKEYRATGVEYSADDERARVSMELSGAYPEEAGIVSWRRTCALHRAGGCAEVEIKDVYRLQEATADIVLSLLSLQRPLLREDGVIELENEHGERLLLHYDAERLHASAEAIAVEDARMKPVWGDAVYRILLRAGEASLEGEWKLTVEAAAAAPEAKG